jgi:multiple sugar transport system permease protein
MAMAQVMLKAKRRNAAARREAISAYLFLAPSLIVFLAFVLIPLIYVVYLSFMKYDILTPAVFNNYKNWIMMTVDKRFPLTVGNSVKFVLLLVPMHMIIGVLLALGVHSIQNRAGVYALRTIYYFPTLIATSSVAIAWTFILNTDLGIVNFYLSKLGFEKIPWLASSFWVYPATMLFSLWKFVGGYFLYFFIGLQSIDRTYMEAASIDGAGTFRKFFSVTLPMLTPTLFFVLTTNIIGCIQIFDEPYMLTGGGPGDASRSLSLFIFETAYKSHKYGYASAISLVLLVFVLIITLLQFRLSNTWVNYDRE